MTAHQATAEVFLTAFRSLPQSEKNIFLNRLAKDASIRKNLIGMVITQESYTADDLRTLDKIVKKERKQAKSLKPGKEFSAHIKDIAKTK